MKTLLSHLSRALFVPLLVATLASTGVLAQQPPAAAPEAAPPAAARFSRQDLDQLLAPIALYPDALVAQVLMASAYPLQVGEAARWSKANPTVKDKALEDAMLGQSWEPAVKSLTTVPQVLQQMSDKLDWTEKLGQAFLAQQADVMKTVQALRAKAHAAGNLKSTSQQVVKTEVVSTQTVYIIEPAQPTVVYVPTYNPYTIYGTWWYPAPPYYMYPPAYVYPPGVAFATGVVVGAAIWGNTNWHGNSVTVNVNQYNSYNKTSITSSNYQYNAQAQSVNKGSVQSQAQAQGVTKSSVQSQAQAQGMTTSSVQSQGQAAKGAGAGSTSAMSASSMQGGSSFSGAGTGAGASTREASARGGTSRPSGGGGGRRR